MVDFKKIGIVYSGYYTELAKEMLTGAREQAKERGFEIVHELEVSGSFDVVLPCKQLMQQKDIVGVVILGAIVKGKTDHDQVIGHTTAKTLQELSIKFDKVLGFGIIGPGVTFEQAKERAYKYGQQAVKAIEKQINAIDKLK